jgi:ABC-type antimicrobial peptide transport system permease subunit
LRAGGFPFDLMKRLKLIESAFLILLSFAFANLICVSFLFALVSTQSGRNIWPEIAGMLKGYPVIEVVACLPLMILLTYLFQILPVRKLYKLPVCDLIREL